MDELSQGLLHTQLELASTELQPVYEQARELLVSRMANVSIESYQEDTRQREQNLSLIKSSMRYIPAYDVVDHKAVLRAKDNVTFAGMYGSLVLIRCAERSEAFDSPAHRVFSSSKDYVAYIIGSAAGKKIDGAKTKEVLFYNLDNDPNGYKPIPLLIRGTMRYRQYKALEEEMAQRAINPPGEAFEAAYSHDQKCFVFNKYRDSNRLLARRSLPVLPLDRQAKFQYNKDNSWGYGIIDEPIRNGLNDREMARYNVYDHLIKLALRFGKLDTVKEEIEHFTSEKRR